MKRILVYVQHLLGTGHLYRTARITSALAQAGYKVTLVSGGMAAPDIDFGDVPVVQLPPVRTDAGFTSLYDHSGQPLSNIFKQDRIARLLETFEQAHPDLLLIETYPFGRRQMRFELLPLLDCAQNRASGRPVIASSIRDVIQPKTNPARVAEIHELVEQYFDFIFVHGDENFIAFDQTFPTASRFSHKLVYTGYVGAAPAVSTMPRRPGHILVSAGGGAVGQDLYRAAIDAAAMDNGKNYSWHLLVGKNIPDELFSSMRRQQLGHVVVERNRPDFPDLLSQCAVSVSQAGYNTLMDILATNTPAVVIPFEGKGEREQSIRARVFEDKGRLAIVKEQQLCGTSLLNAIEECLNHTSPGSMDIKMNGSRSMVAFIGQTLVNSRCYHG